MGCLPHSLLASKTSIYGDSALLFPKRHRQDSPLLMATTRRLNPETQCEKLLSESCDDALKQDASCESVIAVNAVLFLLPGKKHSMYNSDKNKSNYQGRLAKPSTVQQMTDDPQDPVNLILFGLFDEQDGCSSARPARRLRCNASRNHGGRMWRPQPVIQRNKHPSQSIS